MQQASMRFSCLRIVRIISITSNGRTIGISTSTSIASRVGDALSSSPSRAITRPQGRRLGPPPQLH